MSEERIKYLKRIKKEKVSIFLIQIGIVAVFFILWEVLANLGIIDSFIMSSPSRMMKTVANLSQNGVWEHISITCIETIVGFLLGTFLGTIIAIFLWWSKFLAKIMDPFLVILNSLPKVALGPVIIIWVGAGTNAIIFMSLAISLVVTILEIENGFLNTDKELIKMAKTFGSNIKRNCNSSK